MTTIRRTIGLEACNTCRVVALQALLKATAKGSKGGWLTERMANSEPKKINQVRVMRFFFLGCKLVDLFHELFRKMKPQPP